MNLTIIRRLPLAILALLGMALLSLMLAHTAHAATWNGPMKQDNNGVIYFNNSAAYGDSYPNGSRQMEYVVSYDDYTDITQTDILIYMPTRYGTIQIINKDLCVNTETAVANSDGNYAPNMPAGTPMTDYRLIRPDGVSIVFARGYWNYGTPAACANATLNMVAGSPLADSAQIDPDSGMYVYRIRANAVLGGAGGKFANGFRISAPAGSYISQDSEGSATSFGMQPSFPVPGPANNPQVADPPHPYKVYTEVDIPFGPDCSLPAGQTATKTFEIYDGDNVGNFDVQPRPFGVQIFRHSRATGAFTGIAPLTVVAGTAANQGNDLWNPTGGNQTTTRFSFTASGDEIYKLHIYRLYFDNTLQFKIPFDNIWFFRQCQNVNPIPTTVRPVVTMTPANAEVGDTLTGTARVQHVTNSGGTARVNYGRLIWSDTTRNGVYDAGERVFGGTPDSGTVNVPPAGYNFLPWSEVADTGIHGGRVCIYLSIASSNPTTTIQSSPATACADIGKKPHLQVMSGDVMVGGTFRNGSGVCPAAPADIKLFGMVPKTLNGVTYSSFADFGAFSLGEIKDFGANGTAPTAAGMSNYVTYGNTPAPLGYFYSSGATARGNPLQPRCLNDPFAQFGPKATANSGGSTIDVSTLGADTSATASGTVTLTASRPLPEGYRRVIYVRNASQVTISQNITYADQQYASIDRIPQLIVLSEDKIVVNGAVTRLDGLYATKTDFQTCDVAPRLATCNQQLTVNGAVIAGGNVLPYRTFGAQAPNYGDKSEIFRLRPDVLFNQVPRAGEQTYVRTMDEREVPARF